MKINFICAYSIDYNYIVEDAWEWDGAKNDAFESGMNKIGEGLWFKIQTRSEFIYIDLDNPNLKLHKSWITIISDAIKIIRDKKISQIL